MRNIFINSVFCSLVIIERDSEWGEEAEKEAGKGLNLLKSSSHQAQVFVGNYY